jgi:hypothetical protein
MLLANWGISSCSAYKQRAETATAASGIFRPEKSRNASQLRSRFSGPLREKLVRMFAAPAAPPALMEKLTPMPERIA